MSRVGWKHGALPAQRLTYYRCKLCNVCRPIAPPHIVDRPRRHPTLRLQQWRTNACIHEMQKTRMPEVPKYNHQEPTCHQVVASRFLFKAFLIHHGDSPQAPSRARHLPWPTRSPASSPVPNARGAGRKRSISDFL